MKPDYPDAPCLMATIAAMPGVLTPTDLAVMLKVSKKTIFRMTAAGTIPHFRIGQQIRFNPKSLAQWLRSREA